MSDDETETMFRMLCTIRRAHLVAGLAGIIAFLATGLYMDRFHGHLRGYDDTVRMLFRSSHIYLLLAALTNTMLGLYLRPAGSSWRRALQLLGSAALLAALALFLVGFCTEPYLSGLERPWSRMAIYLAFAAGIFHVLAAVPSRDTGDSLDGSVKRSDSHKNT